MGLLTHRRLRLIAVATLFTVITTYTFYRPNDQVQVPWIDNGKPSSEQLEAWARASRTASIVIPKKTQPPSTIPGIPNIDEITFKEPIQPGPVKDSISPEVVLTTPETSPSPTPSVECMKYEALQRLKQQPWSDGARKFPYQRPPPECRTFNLPEMETLMEKMKGVIKDPDLFRLFENSYPNTLDTMIKWRGFAEKVDEASGNATTTDEELTYVITGDVSRLLILIFIPFKFLPFLSSSCFSSQVLYCFIGGYQ